MPEGQCFVLNMKMKHQNISITHLRLQFLITTYYAFYSKNTGFYLSDNSFPKSHVGLYYLQALAFSNLCISEALFWKNWLTNICNEVSSE